jgi:hypothetical protein
MPRGLDILDNGLQSPLHWWMRHDYLVPIHHTNGGLGRDWNCLPLLCHHRTIIQPRLKSIPHLENQFNVPETSSDWANAGQNGRLSRKFKVISM